MTALQKIAQPRDFLLIEDSKLVSYANVSAMIDAATSFIASAVTLVAIDRDSAAEIDSATEILIRYKGQEVAERRYSAFKGPRRWHRCSSRTTGASPP